MAIDEYLYGKIANYFKNRKKISSEIVEKTVLLADIKQRLTIIARALSGNAIEIYAAEREGGYKNNSFFFPASFFYLILMTKTYLFTSLGYYIYLLKRN